MNRRLFLGTFATAITGISLVSLPILADSFIVPAEKLHDEPLYSVGGQTLFPYYDSHGGLTSKVIAYRIEGKSAVPYYVEAVGPKTHSYRFIRASNLDPFGCTATFAVYGNLRKGK